MVVCDKLGKACEVAERTCGGEVLGQFPLEDLITRVEDEVRTRKID